MKKILITGSTGFIGSNLLKELYSRNKIFIILRNKSQNIKKIKNNKNIKIISYREFDELNKKLKKLTVDIVIHCATHYVKNHNYKDILELNKSNILFGNVILENLKKMKTKKFINFSTVWEDYNSIENNSCNLYSVYKKSFSNIIDYYSKILPSINFFNIMISDTFGKNDNRPKIINILKKNYRYNKITKIVSKNLFINLLNINDIINAINIILKKDIKAGKYLIKNNSGHKMVDLISAFNKNTEKKLKVKWLSNKIINEKIYPYKKLKGWTPKESSKIDIIKIIQKK
jgi:nucleoside-diphosphate-sugar epimerase